VYGFTTSLADRQIPGWTSPINVDAELS